MIAIKVMRNSVQLVNVPNELKALQEQVGGYIEHYYLGSGVSAIVDEEGALRQKKWINEKVKRVFGKEFFGIVLLLGTTGEEFCNCPEVEAWYEELEKA